MDKYNQVKRIFESNSSAESAKSMTSCFEKEMTFYGLIPSEIKKLLKSFFISEKDSKAIDWNFLDKCCEDGHREFQYLIWEYLLAMKKYVKYEDIEKIKDYILSAPWEDNADYFYEVIGNIGLKDKRVSDLMVEWSESKDIWLKRTAILHQLTYKEKTDCEYLEKIICNCFRSDRIVINHAIGLALLNYSITDPQWVKDFIKKYKNKLNSLSIMEASKYIG